MSSFIIIRYVWQILWRGPFCPPLPPPSVSSPEKADHEPILNRVKVGKSSYSSKDLIIRKRVVTCDRSTLFYWSSCYMSLKSFLQLYNVICNCVTGQRLIRRMGEGVVIRMCRCAFSIQTWLRGGSLFGTKE